MIHHKGTVERDTKQHIGTTIRWIESLAPLLVAATCFIR